MFSGHFHRRNLPHIQHDFRSYFLTFVTFDRWVLPATARELTMGHILFDHGRCMALHVAVVMPDHVHLVLTPGMNAMGWSHPLATILKGIKGSSARSINRRLKRIGPVWQHESFDHELRRDEDLRRKCEYVCNNPVRKGLASSADEYPWIWREWVEGM
ncbi:MAG TPA: transposase [Thermoanaerobaculia bacterium]|nr:transposase [Thermoanaerobaculia bacterium]